MDSHHVSRMTHGVCGAGLRFLRDALPSTRVITRQRSAASAAKAGSARIVRTAFLVTALNHMEDLRCGALLTVSEHRAGEVAQQRQGDPQNESHSAGRQYDDDAR